jgi:tetraacyldisaccharide-1-P 4'-kinase
VVSRAVATDLLDVEGRRMGAAADLRGRRVFLMSGIANPEAFRDLVQGLGARIIGWIRVGDHRPFTTRQLRRAAGADADLVLCTEKDAARMHGHPGSEALTALAIDVELQRGRRALGRVLRGGGVPC